KEFDDVRLIMVGEYKKEIFHSYYGILKARVTEFGIADRVIFTGYLTDDDLVVLLNISTVLVLPSLMEGFGLPAVEAAACGCPVVASKASPLPELLGEGGIFVDPTPDALHSAIAKILGSPELRARMSQATAQAASHLTWDAAARQMIDVMHKV